MARRGRSRAEHHAQARHLLRHVHGFGRNRGAGVDPLKPTLADIDGVTSPAALLKEIAKLQTSGANVVLRTTPTSTSTMPPTTSADRSAADWLPDRDYYTKTGSVVRLHAQGVRRSYRESVDVERRECGGRHAVKRRESSRPRPKLRESVARSESRGAIRRPSITRRRSRHSHRPRRRIGRRTSATDHGTGDEGERREPKFFKRLNELVAATPVADWRAYLRYHALSEASPWLSTPFVNENFKFSARFTGAKELLPRWKRCLQATDGSIGEALGQAYVAKTFPPEARARAKALIDDIRASFGQRVQALDWMTPATKKQALNKLALMGEKVGYPDKWRDYSKLETTEGPFVLNVARANEFEWKRGESSRNAVDRPVGHHRSDGERLIQSYKTRWSFRRARSRRRRSTRKPTTPRTTARPEETGPARAHHGFDDEGGHFMQGNLRDWWTAADLTLLRSAEVVDQFNGYVQIDTFHVKGKLTLGESIADYGGTLTGVAAARSSATAAPRQLTDSRRATRSSSATHRAGAALAPGVDAKPRY